MNNNNPEQSKFVVRVLASTALAWAALAHGQTQTVTRTVEFQYDAYGSVIQQVVEPDDPKYRVTTNFVAHPNYGVPTSKTTTWLDPVSGATQTRTEGTGYDSRYRYAESSTNAKNQTSTSTHDPATGNVLTSTDPDQLTTAWQYDFWGRKTRESRADGTATSLAYRACVDS
jgi:YD repeat-containing protein